jgi:hypothetical protein
VRPGWACLHLWQNSVAIVFSINSGSVRSFLLEQFDKPGEIAEPDLAEALIPFNVVKDRRHTGISPANHIFICHSRDTSGLKNSTAVRAWGLNAQGRPFSHHAQAENVSHHNALLGGIHSPLRIGSVFGLQWQQCKTRRTVVAVFASGASLRKFYVEPVSGQPWPSKATKPANVRNASQDRRKSARHKIALSIEVRMKSGLPSK